MDEAERVDSLARGRQPHAGELQDILDLCVGIGAGFDLAVYHQQGKAMRQRPEKERGVRHVAGRQPLFEVVLHLPVDLHPPGAYRFVSLGIGLKTLPEHQPVETGIRAGKGDIGDAAGKQIAPRTG